MIFFTDFVAIDLLGVSVAVCAPRAGRPQTRAGLDSWIGTKAEGVRCADKASPCSGSSSVSSRQRERREWSMTPVSHRTDSHSHGQQKAVAHGSELRGRGLQTSGGVCVQSGAREFQQKAAVKAFTMTVCDTPTQAPHPALPFKIKPF